MSKTITVQCPGCQRQLQMPVSTTSKVCQCANCARQFIPSARPAQVGDDSNPEMELATPIDQTEEDLETLAERARFRREMESQALDWSDWNATMRSVKRGALAGIVGSIPATLAMMVCFFEPDRPARLEEVFLGVAGFHALIYSLFGAATAFILPFLSSVQRIVTSGLIYLACLAFLVSISAKTLNGGLESELFAMIATIFVCFVVSLFYGMFIKKDFSPKQEDEEQEA
jgi:hypothetical protein